MKSLNKLLDEAICAFAVATDEHRHAKQLASEARNRETHCMNKVNEAQKKIDELISVLKKEAPRDSDWHRATTNQGKL
jgi:exonuclease VII small subunit